MLVHNVMQVKLEILSTLGVSTDFIKRYTPKIVEKPSTQMSVKHITLFKKNMRETLTTLYNFLSEASPYYLRESKIWTLFCNNGKVCPYCITHESKNNGVDDYASCDACEFGEANGICDEPYSAWREMNNFFIDADIFQTSEAKVNIPFLYIQKIDATFTKAFNILDTKL